jgi:hypothetical protein
MYMALINCPECEKEISDRVRACPHCGYPFVEENTPQKKVGRSKIKPAIITFIIVEIILIAGFFVFKHFTKTEYLSNLKPASEKMREGAAIAKYLNNLAHDVWYNTIHEEHDSKTDKYTLNKHNKYAYLGGSTFNSDFNTSLSSLAADNFVIIQKVKLRNIIQELNELMKPLQNPPSELQNCYNDLDRLYSSFQTLTELAINPSGNLTTFASKINDSASSFSEYYNKIQLYIP